MNTFLNHIAHHIKASDSDPYSQLVIFPSSRSLAFFEQTFGHGIETTQWLPHTATIGQLVNKFSVVQSIPKDDQLIAFVKANLEAGCSPSEFVNVQSWGPGLLHDFETLINQQVEWTSYFPRLKAIKEIENWIPENATKSAGKKYLALWERAQLYFENFTNYCLKNKIGTNAMQVAQVVASIEENGVEKWITSFFSNKIKHVHFVGFTALTKNERALFHHISQSYHCKFWLDDLSVELHNHPARHFIDFNKSSFPKEFELVDAKLALPKVNAVSCTGQLEQVQFLMESLKDLSNSDLNNCVVYLADPDAFQILINHIESDRIQLNSGLGIPISHFDFTKEVLSVLSMGNMRTSKNQKPVFSQFRQSFWNEFLASLGDQEDEIKFISQLLNHLGSIQSESLSKNELSGLGLIMEALSGVLQVFDASINLTTIFSPVAEAKNRVKTLQLAVLGDKKNGIQVMSPLEGRNLDFEHVYFLGFNEDNFSMYRAGFIPSELEIEYELPGMEDKNSVMSYHIYRSIKRAKNVVLLFSENSASFDSGEPARFIPQLQILYDKLGSGIRHYANEGSIRVVSENTVEKTDETVKAVQHYLSNKGLSPSALNTYLLNPLDFYLGYVLGVREPEDANPLHPNKIGNIAHSALEVIYEQVIHKAWKNDKNLEEIIKVAMKNQLGRIDANSIEAVTILTIIKGWIAKFLKYDLPRLDNNVSIVSLENEYSYVLDKNKSALNIPIRLKGYIDRIEKDQNSVGIIDYKTGKVVPKELEVSSADLEFLEAKNSKANQLAMYTYIYMYQMKCEALFAAIYSFRNSKEGYIKLSIDGKSSITSNSLLPFEKGLIKVVGEMLDPSIPFVRIPHQYEKIISS
ncbi:MAG: PD-(D/E)XK nuclease family protein [Flavobacteriales bacterium]|nr:PD-(D/E)XK nuclease family protein [Flavobacteriales bacterium]